MDVTVGLMSRDFLIEDFPFQFKKATLNGDSTQMDVVSEHFG